MAMIGKRTVCAAFTAPVPLLNFTRPRSALTYCIPRRSLSMKGGPNTRTAAITGASGGIGEQTAIGLIRTLPNLSKLFLCCRSVERGESVAQPLRDGLVAGRRIDVTVVPVELTDNSSVVKCASAIDEALAGESLDLLICNAGIMACPLAFTSNEGPFGQVESQYAVNHLSHALLTNRLLPVLRREGGRVIFVSSLAVSICRSRPSAPLVSSKIEGAVTEEDYSKWMAYGDSKLAMSLYAKALSERETQVESVSLHPGIVQTELIRHLVPERIVRMVDSGSSPGLVGRFFSLFGFKTAVQGAELSIELSKTGEGEFENGAMYIGTGLKKATRAIIPLLDNGEEWQKIYEDVERFVSSIERNAVAGGVGRSGG